jgi:hypothetical protein
VALPLQLHPDKTRLIEFHRLAAANREKRGPGKPETFNFLGFTRICAQSRQGDFLYRRKSRRDRVRAKLEKVKAELRRRMHQTIPEQGQWLRQVVSGFFQYHAVPGNGPGIAAFRFHVIDLWRRTPRRCSQEDGTTWQRMAKIAQDFLPKPRILHPWPNRRFAVRHPRWEPMRESRMYGSVRGAPSNGRPYRDLGFAPSNDGRTTLMLVTMRLCGGQALHKQRFDLLQKTPPEGGNGVVIGMLIRGNKAERHGVIGRQLQFALGKHARSIAVDQNSQQQLRVIARRARAAMSVSGP